MTKQIRLTARFPGVNNTTVWSVRSRQPASSSTRSASWPKTAERGQLDFLFLAEGLRLREQNGLIYDLDDTQADTFTVLAALAAVTEHIGLTGTINSTFNEPYEVARQFATLDHLSGGRSAWNVVERGHLRRGELPARRLPGSGRPLRAGQNVPGHRLELWDSWRGDEILADSGTGQFLATAAPGTFRHRDAFFDIAGQFNVPTFPAGTPGHLPGG